MLSGVYKTKMHQAQAVERHGAAAFVEKPFKLNHLFGKLEGVLGDRFPETASRPRHRTARRSPRPSPWPTRGPRPRPPWSSLPPRSRRPPRPGPHAPGRTAPARRDSAPDRGTFAIRAFPELLADLHRRRATGGLLLRRDKVKKIVFVRGGAPESVKSNRLSECLGRVMVRERMISEADCEESLKRMKAVGSPAGHGADRDGLHQPAQPPLRARAAAPAEAPRGLRLDARRVPVQPEGAAAGRDGAPGDVHRGHRVRGREAELRPATAPGPLGEIAGKLRAPGRGPAVRGAGHVPGRGGGGAARPDGRQPDGAGAPAQGTAVAPGHRPVPVRAAGLADGGAPERAPERDRRHRLRRGRRSRPDPGTGPGTTTRRSSSSRTRCRPATTRGTYASGCSVRSRRCGGWTTSSCSGLRRDAPAEAVRSAAVELLREYRVDGPNSSAEVQDPGAADRRPGGSGARHPGRARRPGPVPRPSCVPAG